VPPGSATADLGKGTDMIWSRGRSQRKAVVTALSAVGDTGMSLLALGVAVNMPEAHLQSILDHLILSGQVCSRSASDVSIPGQRSPRYQLVTSTGLSLGLVQRRPRIS
jgi:hypothetical protein